MEGETCTHRAPGYAVGLQYCNCIFLNLFFVPFYFLLYLLLNYTFHSHTHLLSIFLPLIYFTYLIF